MSELTTDKQFNTRHTIWDLAVLALPLVGLAPLLTIHAIGQWSKYETILLPFCWVALAIISYMERKSLAKTRWRVLTSYLFLALALTVGLGSVVYFSPWAANLAMGFLFIGWALVRFVPGTLTRVLALSSLAFVTLTLPLGMEARFGLVRRVAHPEHRPRSRPNDDLQPESAPAGAQRDLRPRDTVLCDRVDDRPSRPARRSALSRRDEVLPGRAHDVPVRAVAPAVEGGHRHLHRPRDP